MEREQRLEGGWRMMAVVVALGWVLSTIVLMITSLGGSTHRLAAYALALAMLAGLPVLTLMKNLSTHLTDNTEPDAREQKLVAISLAMIGASWAIYAFS